MSYAHEWLDLIDISGPFLAVPVLKNTLEQGLLQLEPQKKKDIRQAYDEWREALDENDPNIGKFHTAWVDLVLKQILELDDDGCGDVLKPAAELPEQLTCDVLEHGVTLQPDYAVIDSQHADTPLMLIKIYAPEVDLNEAVKGDGWASTPADRMVHLCRDAGTRLGIVTNGEQWMFVDAPVVAVTSFATWYARLWSQEPETLQAFITLFGVRRFFLDQTEQLPALLDQSLQYQDEVTDALGGQVRRAVEVLIQALDKANIDDDGKLLAGIDPRELYEAGLTVMMRLVFLLSAEERDLLLLGDERYESNYAVSTLRMQLRAESDEILDRRWDAWSRLLAIFRAVYGGIEHETLRMPALGGSLFDPDRFPFLEGRAKDSNWKEEAAHPLPINNHTVLLLLDAIQLYQGRALSYRGLDIEQLGYVYEGLLDHTVKRAKEVTLELDATKNAKQPWVTLNELALAKEKNTTAMEELLQERTGSSISRVRNDLKKEVSEEQSERLFTSCQNDSDLRDQLKPFFHLIRSDSWGYPLVYPKGSFMVTTGEDRRQTGSHYTPISLTEAIVRETLEPVVYVGPAEGKPREEWLLKSPAELLDLKVCDPAMGSGAFLVQVCRWLGERVVEAWSQAEASGYCIGADGNVSDKTMNSEPMPKDLEERAIFARRLIAERCIYGVDLNSLAVELAKLSVWLVTLAKGRPFGFLDHNLKCGDSLLGIHRLEQLTELSLEPNNVGQTRIFGRSIGAAVNKALSIRRELRAIQIRDIRDVEKMAALDWQSSNEMDLPECVADAFIGHMFAAANRTELEGRLDTLAVTADEALQRNEESRNALIDSSRTALAKDSTNGRARRPFHWPLEFPEVFVRQNGGFDAIVGNPPFLGGQHITGVAGTAYRDWLVSAVADNRRGSADLVAYFFLRAYSILRLSGGFGLLAVNTIAQGDTRQVALEPMLMKGAVIRSAYPNEAWPGAAAVITSRIQVHKGEWLGAKSLLGRPVSFISAFLSDQEEWSPKLLRANEGVASQGTIVLGKGFVLTNKQAQEMLDADPSNADVIFPYLNGRDLNTDPEQRPSRWVINFWDWPEERAKEYELPFRHVLQLVKPIRLKNNRAVYRNKWWQFAEKRPALCHQIGLGHYFEKHPKDWDPTQEIMDVLVSCRVTKFVIHTSLQSTCVFDVGLNVIVPRPGLTALLSSVVYDCWVRKQASSLKRDIRYTLKDCFETFAFPKMIAAKDLDSLSRRFYKLRAELMSQKGIGLTKLYNAYHDRLETAADLEKLRSLQSEIDLRVVAMYGWEDLDLDYDYHEVQYLPAGDNVRFTISESVRLELLRRLSLCNRERYQDELGDGSQAQKHIETPKGSAEMARETTSQEVFDFAAEPSTENIDT